jgi:hypothetical protein
MDVDQRSIIKQDDRNLFNNIKKKNFTLKNLKKKRFNVITIIIIII